MIITKFTDYNIDVPNWFINEIKNEINLRDLKGITNNRIDSISVTAQHPFIQLINDFIETENAVKNTSILPCISVTESNENQEIVTIGQGRRAPKLIDSDFVNFIRTNFADYTTRNKEGIITNEQLNLIESHLANNDKLYVHIDEFFLRTSVFVSLWTNTFEEYNVLSKILRSVLFEIRLKMLKRNVIDINISTDKGLVNTNFGRIIYGQETEIIFLNAFRNYTITDEQPLTAYDVITSGNYKNTIDNTNFFLYDIE